MSAYYEIPCENCAHLNDINDNVCSSCGRDIDGPVNIRRAKIKPETESLEKRYVDAKNFARINSLELELTFLEREVITNGKAVINTNANINFLWEWLVKQSVAYNSYKRQIVDNSRKKAKYQDDLKRSITDSILFGSEIDVIYSALSIDETGLASYGDITIILKTTSIERRTSSLETNSYLFLEWARSRGWTDDKPLPPGYMSVWHNSFKLAAAKLAKSLKSGISIPEIARLILTSTKDRNTDGFIELYIYGKIVATVIEKIKIPAGLKTSLNAWSRLRLNDLEKRIKIEYF